MTAAEITAIPLSTADEARLLTLEDIVERGKDTFVEVGKALAEIRDGKLYRATHATWGAYVQDRWDIGRSRAHRLIDAARVAEMLPTGNVPNERQAREMVGLEPVQAETVWADACERSEGRPTASTVRAAAAPYRAPAPQRPRRKPLGDAYRAATWELSDVVQRIARLHQDDRFDDQRDALARVNIGDVDRLIDQLTRLRSALSPDAAPTLDLGTDTSEIEHDVRIEIRGRTALVLAGEWIANEELRRLGVTPMRDVRTKKLSFPAERVDDLCAALEDRRKTIDVRMPPW